MIKLRSPTPSRRPCHAPLEHRLRESDRTACTSLCRCSVPGEPWASRGRSTRERAADRGRIAGTAVLGMWLMASSVPVPVAAGGGTRRPRGVATRAGFPAGDVPDRARRRGTPRRARMDAGARGPTSGASTTSRGPALVALCDPALARRHSRITLPIPRPRRAELAGLVREQWQGACPLTRWRRRTWRCSNSSPGACRDALETPAILTLETRGRCRSSPAKAMLFLRAVRAHAVSRARLPEVGGADRAA